MNSITLNTDFLVIGSGAAGLNAALHASRYGNVQLVTKSSLKESSSYWAQGGIAAVLREQDSFKSHQHDTLAAGRGLCNPEAVALLVKEGANEVRRYIDEGMSFDKTNGAFDLGLEGGHSNRRVLHANGAATGQALIDFLTRLVKQKENIRITEHAFVYQLFSDNKKCRGAAAYSYKKEKQLCIESPVTILATGGYSGLYRRSTNPHTSTGDGLWLGYYAGADLHDLEFIQFHPTAFYAEDAQTFLISEAVRGEGARLYNEHGERFMAGIDQKELAPRDVVSKAIFHQIQNQRSNYVYLDVRHLDTDNIRSRFPNLVARIEKQGVDIDREGIPIAPAAHYCIGGIATDLQAQTRLEGLYACGEVAATGVHGANRLASNSLLECLVFSKRAVEHAKKSDIEESKSTLVRSLGVDECFSEHFSELYGKVAALLSQYVGIERHEEDMSKAFHKIQYLQSNLFSDKNEYYGIRARGLLNIAELIIRAAQQRKESRGVHQRSDFSEPKKDPEHIEYQKEHITDLI